MIVSRVRATLVHAWYAAIIAGGLQVLIAAVRRFGMDQFIWVSRDFAWMTPIGYLILFTAAVLPVAALSLAVPSRIGERLPALVFDTLAALGVILMFPRLHSLAALILAVGVGIRGAAAQPRADGHRRRARQLITATVVVLAGISVVGEVAHRRSESRALAALPAAPHGAPNVLLIILDTVRAASMSFMGYARETTPEMAKFAAGGVVFDQAYSTAPWTLPSHAGIFTARFPSSLSTDWRAPLDGRNRTLAEAMARRGYVTSGFAANHFYTSWESGLTRGFVHYEDYRRTVKQVLLSTSLLQTNFFWSVAHDHRLGHIAQQLLHLDLRTQQMWTSDRKVAALAVDQFLGWERDRSGRPFFAFINLYDAHLPYDPPAPWGRRFATSPVALDRYDGAVAYMDHELGRLFGELARRGVLDSTLVIVTSDHGEGFGEHGLSGHGNSLYRPELHVPLVMRFPGHIPSGRRVDEAVSLRDLGATVLELSGGNASDLGGASLGGLWDSTSARPHSPVVSEVSAGINTEPHDPVSRGPMRSLIDAQHHYIHNGDGVEELYAYRADSVELHDVATARGAFVTQMRDAAARALSSFVPR